MARMWRKQSRWTSGERHQSRSDCRMPLSRSVSIPTCYAVHASFRVISKIDPYPCMPCYTCLLESQSNCHTPSWRLAVILRCQALAYSDESACLDHTHWSCLRSPVQQARVSEPFIFTHATSLAPFWFVTSDKISKGQNCSAESVTCFYFAILVLLINFDFISQKCQRSLVFLRALCLHFNYAWFSFTLTVPFINKLKLLSLTCVEH